MRWIFFLSIFFCFVFDCISQQNQRKKIDSIYALLQSVDKPDTNRVRYLNNYARMIRYDSVDRAMVYADQALEIAKKLKDDLWIGQSLYSKGIINFKKNDYPAALAYFDTAGQVFTRLKKYPLLANCLNFKAEVYQNLGKNAQAIDIFHDVIELSQKIGNKREEGVAYGNIGVIYSTLEMHRESIASYEQALRIFRDMNDTMLIGVAVMNIGHSHYNLKDYSKAKLSLDTALFLFERINRSDAIAMVKADLGMTLGHQHQYDSALNLLTHAEKEFIKGKDKRWLAICYSALAKVMMLATDSLKRLPYSYEVALGYAGKGLAIAREIGYISNEFLTLQTAAELYAKQGNFEKAFESFNRYVKIKDSVSGSNKIQEIAIKEIQFENDKKQSLREESHVAAIKQQKTVRNFSIAGASLAIVASMLLFSSYKRRHAAKTKQQEAELKTAIVETEIKALRAQMNPHFIFNSLNSVGDYIARNNTQLADEYLTSFAKLMRLVLENSEKREVSLASDLKALELYMKLEALRMNHRFGYEIRVGEDIDPENTLVPPLLLQPFVENSIWHGIAKNEEHGKILIVIEKEADMIRCVVEDNGSGRKLNLADMTINSDGKKSLGVKITKERIEVLNKLKSSNGAVVYTDLKQGTRVEVTLPFEMIYE